jgi:glutaredoxin 3
MNVAVWSKTQCPYCDMAKRLLEQKGIEYTSVTLGEEFTRDDVVAKFPTARTFPIIEIDNEYIGGYNELRQKIEGD